MPKNELFSYINDYIKKNKLYDKDRAYCFDDWDEKTLGDFIEGLFDRIHQPKAIDHSYFNFSVNSTLSGAPHPCSAYQCRLDNIHNVAKFSALYADKLLIKSPIDKHYNDLKDGYKINTSNLFLDLIILETIEPLLNADIIGFSSEHTCLCESCLKKYVYDEDIFNHKIDSIESTLAEQILDQIIVTLINDDSESYLIVEGAEKYGYHSKNVIKFDSYIPEVIKKYSNLNKVVLNKEEILDVGVIDDILNAIIPDLILANINCNQNGYSYLTNRDFEIEIVKTLQDSNTLEESENLSKGLLHNLPMLMDIDIGKIIKLRQSDGEAFKVYRDSINGLLLDRPKFNKKELHEFQRDIIIPEIHKIESCLKHNKKALYGSLALDLIFLGATMSIGLLSNTLPISVASATVASIPTIKKVISNVISKESAINKDNFYFLWKLGRYK